MKIDNKTLRSVFFGVGGCIILYWLLHETERVKAVYLVMQDLLSPFIVGAILAFILNVPMRAIEKQLDTIENTGVRRAAALLLTIVVLVAVIMIVFQLLLPQLWETTTTLINQLPNFFWNVEQKITTFLAENPQITDWLIANTDFETFDWAGLLKNVANWATQAVSSVLDKAISAVGGVVDGIWDLFVSVVFALYALAAKEELARQARKLIYAILPERWGDQTIRTMRLSNTTFSNFISGQCVEVCILGLMFAVSMWIFGMPYAPLVSVLVAVTAFVPLVGAFVGCILGAFFILVDNPVQAVYFVILFLVLQQIEGNLIYPRVVGSSIGLPSMWVLVAVAIGGGLMGITGMVLMIPFASVLYTLLREWTAKRLKAKNIPAEKLMAHPPQISSGFKKNREERKAKKKQEAQKPQQAKEE